MYAYCGNNPIAKVDKNGCSPTGILTLKDYYIIHKMVQVACVIRYGYDMEVYVRERKKNEKKGRIGYLDLYDFDNNMYYEVKSEAASGRKRTFSQMEKYDNSIIEAKRYENYNITQSPSRGTNCVSGTVYYGIYDVHYELREPGLIVYTTEVNWERAISLYVLAAVVAAAPYTAGQSLSVTAPAILNLLPG